MGEDRGGTEVVLVLCAVLCAVMCVVVVVVVVVVDDLEAIDGLNAVENEVVAEQAEVVVVVVVVGRLVEGMEAACDCVI